MTFNTLIVICFLLLIKTYENVLNCPDGHFWNIYKNVCSPCGLNCKNCNQTHCLQCENFPNYQFDQQLNGCTKINFVSHRRFLVDCTNDANCDICVPTGGGHNNSPCTTCFDGFAPDGAGRCKACDNTCKTCDAPNNAGNCLTCFPTDFLQISTSHCKNCNTQYGNRCLECNQINCTLCQSGFYPISGNPGCAACPSQCILCTTNGCQKCDQFYELDLNQTCSDICGDSHNINLPCDLPFGIAFDGCTDNCQIESNFVCDITNFKTDCFYQGVVNLTMDSMDRNPDSNTIDMIINLYPPLYAFQSTNLYQLFSINDTELVIQTLTYQNGNLIMKVQFTATVIDRPFQIQFNPNTSSDPHINQAQQQSLDTTVVTSIPSYYYSSQTYTIAKVLAAFCILIVILSYLVCFIGIGSKRLAGLQLMFVLQFAWVSLLWLPNFMPITFYSVTSLKYSSGFNVLIQKYSFSSPLPIQAMSFSVDTLHFNNNFNLSLILYALPLSFAIVFKIASLNGKYKKKVIPKYQFSLQMALYGTMFNFIGFLVFSIIFFSYGQKTSSGSFIALAFSILVTSGVLVKFYFDPDPFDRFRYEFKIQQLALNHIYFHTLNLLLMVLFLCLIITAPWVCCIPPLLLLAYTLIYRPYLEFSQNLRSAYFQFVIVLTGGFRVYYISSAQWRYSDQSGLFLVLLLCIFYIPAIIWSYVSVIRSYCTKYNGEKNLKKQEVNYVLFEDLKFIKQIANTQKLLQIENFLKSKRGNDEGNQFGDIKIDEEDQKKLAQKRQLVRNIAKEIKNEKINDLSSERKQYQLNDFEEKQKNENFMVDHVQKQQNTKKRLEIDEKKFQRAIGIQLSHFQKQKNSKVIKEEKKPFKIETQPIFQNLFKYVGTVQIPQPTTLQISREYKNQQDNKVLKEEESKKEEEQEQESDKEFDSSKKRIHINSEEIEKDEKIKQALSKEINFIKLKMGEKLAKQVKYQHLESYNKIQ